MADIANKLADEAAQRKRDAWPRYAELLSDNVDDAAQVKELHDLMELLGKSPADVQKDAATLKTAATVRTRIDAAKGAGTREREAKEALATFKEETEQIARQRAAQMDELARAVAQRFDEHAAASRDVQALNELKTASPQLLRQVKPATFEDIL